MLCENPLKNWTAIDSIFFALRISSIPINDKKAKDNNILLYFFVALHVDGAIPMGTVLLEASLRIAAEGVSGP